MNFERGQDTKEALDVGLKSKALIVDSLYYLHINDIGLKFWRKMDSERVPDILQDIVEHPEKDNNYQVDFITESGLIYNPEHIQNFNGTYFKYIDEFYLIPNYEL